MRRIASLATLIIALSACAQYALVEAKTQDIGGAYSVEPQIEWSRHSEGKVEIWTVDGASLEAVRFFKALGDGDRLFEPPRRSDDEEFPSYQSGMRGVGVMELVVDSLARAGAGDVEPGNLRPARFGSVPGFRFELSFLSADGLEMQGLAAGAVIEDKLHLILYTGARLHYFPKYRDPVERMIGSIEMV